MNFNSNSNQSPLPAPYPPANEFFLAASKAYHTLSLTARPFGQDLFVGEEDRTNHIHDAAVDLANNNLKSIDLALLDSQNQVVCKQTIRFNGSAAHCGDAGTGGQEVPLLTPGVVVDHSLTITSSLAKERPYAHYYKIKWNSADEDLPLPAGSGWTTAAHAAITGGRQTGEVHVADASCHTIIVTRTIGLKQYGFACCPELKLEGILLHAKHFAKKVKMQFGQPLTAFLIQCPRGIQARAIQLK